MAQAQFSETQFVFGFLKELYLRNMRHGLVPWGSYFMFPSQIVEKRFPVDFFIKHFSHSEFYQFKLSTAVGNGRGRKPLLHGVPSSYQPFYRFKIYNDITNGPGQFELLKKLAAAHPSDLVCYCAPCFYEDSDYMRLFNADQIVDNSILIKCGQFNHNRFSTFNVNDGQNHFLSYKLRSSRGYLCSDSPYEVEVTRRSEVQIAIESSTDFESYLVELISILPKDFLRYRETSNIWEQDSEFVGKFLGISEYLLREKNIIWQPYFKFIH